MIFTGEEMFPHRMNEPLKAHTAGLSEIALVVPGYSARPQERRKAGKYLLFGGRNIKDGRFVTTEKDSHSDELPKDSFRRAVAQPGDIIVSTLFDRRKLYIYQSQDPRAVVNSSCAIIRAPEKSDYIVSYLRTLKGKEQFLRDAAEATGGTFIPRLSIGSLARIQVPLLPLSELQRLGDAHIESSTTDDLIDLRRDLESRDSQITELRREVAALRGQDAEVVRLRSRLGEVTSYYEDRIRKIEAQISTNDLKSRITHGETSKLEFKSSLRWNFKANRDDSKMELAVLKTIAAFCNTNGGELLIGVNDDQTIVGIEHDHFANDDKRVCQIACKPSKDAIWLTPAGNTPEIFYVRHGPSSAELPPREAVRYIQEHFEK